MARYRGPKSKISRRFKEAIFGPDKARERRPYGPGQHGNTRRRKKESEDSVQLAEKQKARKQRKKMAITPEDHVSSAAAVATSSADEDVDEDEEDEREDRVEDGEHHVCRLLVIGRGRRNRASPPTSPRGAAACRPR